MADIRINALATTAASTASDDFVAVDGTAQGTRKLSAYSPTFGGNVTVSGGTLLNSVGGATNAVTNTYATGSANIAQVDIKSGDGTTSSRMSRVLLRSDETSPQRWDVGLNSSKNFTVQNSTLGSAALTIDSTNNAATVAGNLTVSGGTISSGAGNTLLLQQANYGGGLSANASGQVIVAAYNSQPLRLQTQGADVLYLTSGGNVLLGTTTDSGNGKLQLATHTTSAGGIGFGTSLSVYSDSANRFCVVGGTTTRFRLFSTSGNAAELGFDNSELYAQSTTQIRFITNNTTALTLDSSQRCILAGALRLNNAYTAGAPTATGYVTIQDSAGNTYKVLVGT